MFGRRGLNDDTFDKSRDVHGHVECHVRRHDFMHAARRDVLAQVILRTVRLARNRKTSLSAAAVEVQSGGSRGSRSMPTSNRAGGSRQGLGAPAENALKRSCGMLHYFGTAGFCFLGSFRTPIWSCHWPRSKAMLARARAANSIAAC